MVGLAFRGDFDILDEIVFYLSFRNLGNAPVDARVFAVCASGCNDSFDISGAFYTIGKVFCFLWKRAVIGGHSCHRHRTFDEKHPFYYIGRDPCHDAL